MWTTGTECSQHTSTVVFCWIDFGLSSIKQARSIHKEGSVH